MRRLYNIVLATLIVIICLAGGVKPVGQIFASPLDANIDNSYVLDDLDGVKIRNKEFNIADYPKSTNEELSVLLVSEYGFSYYISDIGNYALYIYVYNPAQLNISETSVLNKIQLGVEFNGATANKYSKFSIRCVSISTGEYSGLFYKFRVVDSNDTIVNAVRNYAKDNNGFRAYMVGEIELLAVGNINAEAYKVGMTFNYSGYSDGLGKSDGTSLELGLSVLETLSLEVKHTYYRPVGEQSGGSYIQDQLNSVYFAVPNELLVAYGEMYAAHIEWYEYLTKEILITGNSSVYNKLKNNVGQTVSGYDKDVYYGFIVNAREISHDMPLACDTLYNTSYPFSVVDSNLQTKRIPALYYLFSSGSINAKDYTLSGEELLEYIKDYSKQNASYEVRGKYSSDLFYEELAAGRKRYNDVNILAEKEYSLENYVIGDSWWQKLFGIYKDNSLSGIKGIHKVLDSDLTGTAKAVSDKLFINEKDFNEFSSFYTVSKNQNKTVFLLRFAVTDYYSSPAKIIRDTDWLIFKDYTEVSNNAYLAQQTAFLDLDVIDVKFTKDEAYTVIPTVTSPVDIIPDITPPVDSDGCGDLNIKQIVGIILLLMVLMVCRPIVELLVWLLKLVLNIVMLPFKLIGSIFKRK